MTDTVTSPSSYIQRTARRVVDGYPHISSDRTLFSVDRSEPGVIAELADGRRISVVHSGGSFLRMFGDGIALRVSYHLLTEETSKRTVRLDVLYHHISSLDYLILEEANDLVRGLKSH